ncbi:MAG TPA: ribbon-helix-helix protein, CopG family [Methanocorpusculum sp.]|nr:ribbon-helix-helix protein, CopG family [Methanocorpusculum sp.]
MITKSSDEGFATLIIRVPREDKEALDKVATARRMSMAALVRESILDKIAEYAAKGAEA